MWKARGRAACKGLNGAVGAAFGFFAALSMASAAHPQSAPAQTVQQTSPILGEQPEFPLRAKAFEPQPGQSLPSSAGGEAGPLGAKTRNGFGALGWFGLAMILAAFGLLGAGVAGWFDRPGLRPSPRREKGPQPPATEAKKAGGQAAAPNSCAVDKAAPAEGARSAAQREPVGMLALLDELSPRRRRAQAFAYGARSMPASVAEPCRSVKPKVAQTSPAASAARSSVEAAVSGKPHASAAQPDADEPGVKIAYVIKQLAEGRIGRRR